LQVLFIVFGEGDIEWEIGVKKIDILKSSHIIEVEWVDVLFVYCEKCGQDKNLYVDLYESTKKILRPEFRDNLKPFSDTFIPSQKDFCNWCGSP